VSNAPKPKESPRLNIDVPVMLGQSPNITGKVSDFNDRSIGINPSGAFYKSGTTWARPGEWGGSDATRYSISMDASKSNVLYGKANEVQPPAAWLLVCIKI
jgi:hypothetical protein